MITYHRQAGDWSFEGKWRKGPGVAVKVTLGADLPCRAQALLGRLENCLGRATEVLEAAEVLKIQKCISAGHQVTESR